MTCEYCGKPSHKGTKKLFHQSCYRRWYYLNVEKLGGRANTHKSNDVLSKLADFYRPKEHM